VNSSGLRAKGKSSLNASITVALDAMGGDNAPYMVVAGADLARERYPNVRYILFGDEGRIAPLLEKRKALKPLVSIRHTVDAIDNDMKPSVRPAIGPQQFHAAGDRRRRRRRGELRRLGWQYRRLDGDGQMVLKMLPGIHRPAISSFLPTTRGESVMLDLGANIECDVENLVQFAVMGSIFAPHGTGHPRTDDWPAECRRRAGQRQRHAARGSRSLANLPHPRRVSMDSSKATTFRRGPSM